MDADELSRALSALAALPADDPVRRRVERVAESLIRDSRRRRQRERRLEREAADRELLAATTTGAADRREDSALPESAGSVGVLSRQRRCYVCKQKYGEVSAFYHQLCPRCAAENLAWRSASRCAPVPSSRPAPPCRTAAWTCASRTSARSARPRSPTPCPGAAAR